MARVLFAAPPFAGHLHPTLALARGLRARHDVAIVSTHGARERIEGAGITAEPVLAGADAAVEAIANPPRPCARIRCCSTVRYARTSR